VSRPRQLFLPSIVLDRSAASPLHHQIRAQLGEAIRRGAPDRARLPSSRTLARLLGVSRNTVLAAYDEVAADGLITGRRGAAMMVAARGTNAAVDLSRLLRDAQYPAHTLSIGDPDGNAIHLSY
jgi:GntR family transcriptional regulator/MocR family aminotransferase